MQDYIDKDNVNKDLPSRTQRDLLGALEIHDKRKKERKEKLCTKNALIVVLLLLVALLLLINSVTINSVPNVK